MRRFEPAHIRSPRSAGRLLVALLAGLLSIPLIGASAPTEPERIDVVNATGVPMRLLVDDAPLVDAIEPLQAQKDALRACDGCDFGTGHHTFRAELTRSGETVAVLDTRDADAPIDPSERFDYAVVIHPRRGGDGYALSVYRDDMAPADEGEARIEIRNVAAAPGAEVIAVPPGQGEAGDAHDRRIAALHPRRFQREYDVQPGDFRVEVYESGSTHDVRHLAACVPHMELTAGTSMIVYVGGALHPAQNLDERDVESSSDKAGVCEQFAQRENAFDRDAFDDGFDLRGYVGPALTVIDELPAEATFDQTDQPGPADPYATSTAPESPDAAPTVTVTTPGDGATIGDTVEVTADAADDRGIEYVRFYLDGTRFGQAEQAPYGADLKTRHFPDGEHLLAVEVTDTSGNRSTDEIRVVVENGAPRTDIASPSDGARVYGTISIEVFTFHANDVAGVEVFVDGESIGHDERAPYDVELDTTTLSDGPHEISAVTTDTSGNTSTDAITVFVDNTLPLPLS